LDPYEGIQASAPAAAPALQLKDFKFLEAVMQVREGKGGREPPQQCDVDVVV
jgi:hypothetical protein